MKKVLAILFVISAVGFIVAGCKSGGDDSAAGTAGTTGTTAGAAGGTAGTAGGTAGTAGGTTAGTTGG